MVTARARNRPQSMYQPTHTRTYRRLVEGSTINGATLLSTDYLNHFNEFVMLLELAADMPDMVEELGQWARKSYQQHFADSVFSQKALAIAAYEQSPLEFRVPLDDTVAGIDELITETQASVGDAVAGSSPEAAADHIHGIARDLRARIERAGAIINGARIEDLDDAEQDSCTVMGQDDIDALFS